MPNKTSTLTIGITGGIGAGKSTVGCALADKGVRILDADVVAHDLLAPGTDTYQAVLAHFGNSILNQGGVFVPKQLAEKIFNDSKARQWLEQCMHPVIRATLQTQSLQPHSAPYQAVMIPLLAESGPYPWLDRICVVDTTPAQQRQRIARRDHLDDAQITARLQAQSKRQQRLALADDVLDNTQSLESLLTQIDQLHAFYLSLTQKS